MWKKILGLVAGTLAVVLLITGIMTAVNADSANTGITAPVGLPPGPHAGPPPGRGFGPPMGSAMLEKVAARLNIDKTRLEDAFKQVMLEGQQARTNDMFAAWVKDGKLTQEQADAYKTWQAAKPADVPGFPFFGSAKASEMLDKLVAGGKMTQAQADAHKAWIAQKPAVELPRPEPCKGRGPAK